MLTMKHIVNPKWSTVNVG